MTVQRTRLANGMTLLSEELHAAPVVALQAWVHAGSADERDAESGVAHLHEHMLFKGTARRGVGEIARTVEASGGEINAWTSFDQTVYHLVLAASQATTGLDILADALRHSSFDPTELAREIEVVVEEIRRADDTPARRVSKALFELAYVSHPYRRPVLGTEATVRAMSRDGILDFYRRHYRPERVTLVACGDFDGARLRDQVEAAFGDWRGDGPAPAAVARPPEGPQAEPRHQLLVEDVREARCAAAWHLPAVGHDDIPALDVLSVILGHGESSRLNRQLRHRQQLVNDVYTFAYTPREPGLFMAGGGLKPGKVREGIAAIFDEVYRLRRDPVTEDELEKARVVITSDAAYQKETVQGQARKLGFYEVVAGDYRFEARYMERVAALRPKDVLEVAERYLTDAASLVVQTASAADAAGAGPATPLAEVLPVASRERWTRATRPRPRPAADDLGIVRVELGNGCVLLVRQEESPVVALRAVALGGQRGEDAARAGIGNLFASLWGASSAGLPHDAFARKVAMLGGSVSAFSGRNAVGLRGEFIAAAGHEGLRLWCDAMLEPEVSEADLVRERTGILQRIENRGNNAAGVAFDAFAAALFPTHPYGLLATGTVESVSALTLEQVMAHGRAMAAPPRLVVAVAGGLPAELAIDVLSERLAGGERQAPVPTPAADPSPSERRRLRRSLDKKQSHIVVGGMGTTVHDPARHALEVLTTVLSGQSGRLFLDLRDRRSLAYSVSCSSLEGLEPGHVAVHMGTSPEKVEEGLAGIEVHLQRVRDEPISAEELARAQRYLIGTHAIDLQRCGSRAMSLALGELFGLGYRSYTEYAARIEEVTPEAVQAVARRLLAPERLVEVVVGPGPVEP